MLFRSPSTSSHPSSRAACRQSSSVVSIGVPSGIGAYIGGRCGGRVPSSLVIGRSSGGEQVAELGFDQVERGGGVVEGGGQQLGVVGGGLLYVAESPPQFADRVLVGAVAAGGRGFLCQLGEVVAGLGGGFGYNE